MENNPPSSPYDRLNYRLCVLSEEKYELNRLLDKIYFFEYGFDYTPLIYQRIEDIDKEWLETYKKLMELKYYWRFYDEEE